MQNPDVPGLCIYFLLRKFRRVNHFHGLTVR
jgi:hypothetical protein